MQIYWNIILLGWTVHVEYVVCMYVCICILYVSLCCVYVYVVAWVAVKFGINTTSVVLEMRQISQGKDE